MSVDHGPRSGSDVRSAARRASFGDRHAREAVVIVIADFGMKYLSTDLWER